MIEILESNSYTLAILSSKQDILNWVLDKSITNYNNS